MSSPRAEAANSAFATFICRPLTHTTFAPWAANSSDRPPSPAPRSRTRRPARSLPKKSLATRRQRRIFSSKFTLSGRTVQSPGASWQLCAVQGPKASSIRDFSALSSARGLRGRPPASRRRERILCAKPLFNADLRSSREVGPVGRGLALPQPDDVVDVLGLATQRAEPGVDLAAVVHGVQDHLRRGLRESHLADRAAQHRLDLRRPGEVDRPFEGGRVRRGQKLLDLPMSLSPPR